MPEELQPEVLDPSWYRSVIVTFQLEGFRLKAAQEDLGGLRAWMAARVLIIGLGMKCLGLGATSS